MHIGTTELEARGVDGTSLWVFVPWGGDIQGGEAYWGQLWSPPGGGWRMTGSAFRLEESRDGRRLKKNNIYT